MFIGNFKQEIAKAALVDIQKVQNVLDFCHSPKPILTLLLIWGWNCAFLMGGGVDSTPSFYFWKQ